MSALPTHPDANNPEIGQFVAAAGVTTNFHDYGSVADGGRPALLLHGSGPGVSAWANWRLTLPALARHTRVIAPDIIGFGFTERPQPERYDVDAWVAHLESFLDALALDEIDLIGNSFGGALALRFALRHPQRVRRLVLMGAVSLSFPITEGLDAVWGYTPSVENMRRLLDLFAFDRSLVNDELAELRHRAAARPGVQESFAAMFPAPRQRWIDALASSEDELRGLDKELLIVHGREDRVIPCAVSQRLFEITDRSQLHLFGRCGHWVQIEHAERFNRLVGQFLIEDA
ncbi:MAG: alpha/beta fold hydrolase [Ectothiorhodospiraceae bacterium]|jgi:pimeloyl-ACP methyl ester carboxylesterase|nr:alpha/beta fold hydrolase [Ectothiorhodospiraceae bacterium]